MASKAPKKAVEYCVGAPAFVPALQVQNVTAREDALKHLEGNDFDRAIASWFQLREDPPYVYHAIASVTLPQVQSVVKLGAANGLHAWYRSETGDTKLDPPPTADIEAYISIFLPSTSTASALKGFISNAKKGSIRQSSANYLQSKRFIHASLPQLAALSKAKQAPPNLYLDFWAWSCRNLEWCGPTLGTETVRQSHHVLPVLMHHFGCSVPSHEALTILKTVAGGRAVMDAGSGGGYWTFMLRQYGVDAIPVDSAQSEWRVSWVDDTVIAEAAKWLSRNDAAGGEQMVLLLVYPIVGGTVAGGMEGSFTRGLMAAYKGDTVAVVGTQNHNGYTGFKDMTMNEYMDTEQADWVKVIQIPLPSFAGKDEALFVYQRGERAPPKAPPST